MEKLKVVLYPAKSNATDLLVLDQSQAVQESAPAHLVKSVTALEDVLLLAHVQIIMLNINAVKLCARIAKLRKRNAIMLHLRDAYSPATVRMATVWSTASADCSINAHVEIELLT